MMNTLSPLAAVCVSLLVFGSAIAQPVTMEWSTVGNPGNAADPTTGFGSVGYEYRIGTYEVTNAQYAAFLNAAAAVSDPNGLYNGLMASDPRGGISRSGSPGSFTYTVRSNMGNKPVNFVSWYDAARMANWMTNGQGSGGTESGVYTLNGVNSIVAITRDLSNPNQVFIPTENEWYKAAYHQPFAQGGDSDDYWLYATQSNSVPTVATATSTGDVANPGQDVVNYFVGADWNGQNGNVTTVGSAGSTSFYGAFDMNGNLWEWNETALGTSRGVRGDSWGGGEGGMRSSFSSSGDPPITDNSFFGFRLASPTQPCNAADTVSPFGILNSSDINAFVSAFLAEDSAADLAPPFGIFNSSDINAFVSAFLAGCP